MNKVDGLVENQRDIAFRGVWPALITPIKDNGEVNFPILEKLTSIIVSQKLDGLYVLGSTGQGLLLSESKRMAVLEAVLAVNGGQLPLMVHVGSVTTRESCRLAEHAEKMGVDAISSVGPIYYQSSSGTADMALKHFHAIAASTGIPFFPYQIGSFGFNDGLKEFINRLLLIPNIKGMKLTTSGLLEISAVSLHAGNKLSLFSGADELMCHAALCGTSGAIGSTYNLWGPECQKVRSAFVNDDFALATRFMLAFQKAIFHVLPNFWSFLRQAILYRYGVDVGMPVAPLGIADREWDEDEVIRITNSVINAAENKITE